MAPEHHDLAPAIKLIEYAFFGHSIVANRTPGLMAQAHYNSIKGITFVDSFDQEFWSKQVYKINVNKSYKNKIPTYEDIFNNQVVRIYRAAVEKNMLVSE